MKTRDTTAVNVPFHIQSLILHAGNGLPYHYSNFYWLYKAVMYTFQFCIRPRSPQGAFRKFVAWHTEYARYFITFLTQHSPNTNALGISFIQSLDSIVEGFLILVLQPTICSVNNILLVNKFPSFDEFLQFWKQTEPTEARSDEYGGLWRLRCSSPRPRLRVPWPRIKSPKTKSTTP